MLQPSTRVQLTYILALIDHHTPLNIKMQSIIQGQLYIYITIPARKNNSLINDTAIQHVVQEKQDETESNQRQHITCNF